MINLFGPLRHKTPVFDTDGGGSGGGGKEEGKTRGVLSRRIASNQGRKYILMNLAESQSESESVSESESERESKRARVRES